MDGSVHLDFAIQNYDYERSRRLEDLGFRILRFENKEVFEDLVTVLNEIIRNFKE